MSRPVIFKPQALDHLRWLPVREQRMVTDGIRREADGDLEAFLIAHHAQLVALIDRGAAQRGGLSLEAVEREVSRRERKPKRRAG